jgi:hypothetical protein
MLLIFISFMPTGFEKAIFPEYRRFLTYLRIHLPPLQELTSLQSYTPFPSRPGFTLLSFTPFPVSPRGEKLLPMKVPGERRT